MSLPRDQHNFTLPLPINLTVDQFNVNLDLNYPHPIRNFLIDYRQFTQIGFLAALTFIQCLLLHPIFSKSKNARLARLTIMPVNSLGVGMLPFRVAKKPLENHETFNFFLALVCIYFATKCVEWGVVAGPYYRTPLRCINGVKQWVKEELPEDEKKAQENASTSASDLVGWTLSLMLSARGFGFDWGIPQKANTRSLTSLILRLYKVKLVSFITQAIIVASKDSAGTGGPNNIFKFLGFPLFPARDIVAEGMLNVSFGLKAACDLDKIYTIGVIILTLFNRILSELLGFSNPIHELLDPLYYPMMHTSPHLSNSLNEFWSVNWHQALRRNFVICGGKPTLWISKRLGCSKKLQSVAFIFGVYIASALEHEYLAWVICQKPHHNSYPTNLLPGSYKYFLAQPIGLILEPFLIPFIPKKLGGGKLWVWAFKAVFTGPFRKQFLYFSQDLKQISTFKFLDFINPIF